MIYFAHVKNTVNTGDKRSTPLFYYDFKELQTAEIDLTDLTQINILPDDFIIIGGGGIIDSGNKWNQAMINAMTKTPNVIFWGCGFNYSKPKELIKIDLEKALLSGIRDYKHHCFRFVPCVSCKSRFFDKPYQVKRKIGIIKHHSRPLTLDQSLQDIPFINNAKDIAQIIKFIGESEIILSNSYHALYWSSLLKKKTGRLDCYKNSRFNDCMYEYKAVNTINDIDGCRVQQLTTDDLSYFRWLNDEFFALVKSMIVK